MKKSEAAIDIMNTLGNAALRQYPLKQLPYNIWFMINTIIKMGINNPKQVMVKVITFASLFLIVFIIEGGSISFGSLLLEFFLKKLLAASLNNVVVN